MGFLDNSGDIILDAVLTDAGRERLARGDGSFKVVKFALGDDEINYENYDLLAASTSKDLQILQTPVLEAFTNNTSLMKSKLITITRTDLLYLPVVKLNESLGVAKYSSENVVLVTVDETTTNNMTVDSYLNGYDVLGGKLLRADQGLNTTAESANQTLDSDLVETQYIVEVDNRLGALYSSEGSPAPVSFIDDDSVASYFFSRDDVYVRDNLDTTSDNQQPIEGPRGTYVNFKIRASTNLKSSTYLFDLLGSTFTIGSNTYRYIDTNIRISGATTGYSLSVPVRFIKQN
tara:strand:- start:57 stop:926 length:870 start_codon:yes stop_codon:yes gene_type:complete